MVPGPPPIPSGVPGFRTCLGWRPPKRNAGFRLEARRALLEPRSSVIHRILPSKIPAARAGGGLSYRDTQERARAEIELRAATQKPRRMKGQPGERVWTGAIRAARERWQESPPASTAPTRRTTRA